MPGFKEKPVSREDPLGGEVQVIPGFDPTVDADAPANRLTMAEFAEWKRKKVSRNIISFHKYSSLLCYAYG